jgi:hypothetical protein
MKVLIIWTFLVLTALANSKINYSVYASNAESLLSTPSPFTDLNLVKENKDKKRDTVIVFVHGLYGHGRYTWMNRDAGVAWPDFLKDDQTFNDADIFTYYYETGEAAAKWSITDIARKADFLLKKDIFAYRNIVFVCHSLGGVIIKQMLALNQDAWKDKNISLNLFGVPSKAPELTSIQKALKALYEIVVDAEKVSHIENMINESQANVLFEILNTSWRYVAHRVQCPFTNLLNRMNHM